MNKLGAVGLMLILSAGSALAQTSIGEKTGVHSLVGVSPSTQDFVTEAAISDMFEIEASKLAEQKASPAGKIFAGQMIADHQKTTDELKGLVQRQNLKVTLPAGLDGPHRKMLDKLRGLFGWDFDKKYDSQQIGVHKSAVALFQRYGKGGKDAALKAWANQTLPTLQHHLQMAQGLNQK